MVSGVLSFVQWLVLVVVAHPLHVSVTEVAFDEKDKALEIMMRVFVDDLEVVMRNRLKQPELDITVPKGITVDEMMGPYLAEHFTIQLDGKAQKVKYLGHEKEGEAFIFYVEVSPVKRWKKIQVTNSVIMETYRDQSNLVHVTVQGKVKSLRLTADESTGQLDF
ncbi:DUF6702 family protein [Parachryseolinea silvisoli]|jgi:hypothetical protein|uniref:DUF6702 family protein n=1 Tax=Parachryseolinea silvisoli TaxID=2873601 RepID=UPI002265B205|nr:DUF6702 family protein [Parachryseolinea silvisoli]MCD9016294.1 hypothetical protein [Parachryseolinea silvisoli]